MSQKLKFLKIFVFSFNGEGNKQKLLGLNIDRNLNFNGYESSLCRKVGKISLFFQGNSDAISQAFFQKVPSQMFDRAFNTYL